MATLFPGTILKKTEEDIATFENKGHSYHHTKGHYNPYDRHEKHKDNSKSGKLLDIMARERNRRARPATTPHDLARVSHRISCNYCVNAPDTDQEQRDCKPVQYQETITSDFKCILSCSK